MTVELEKERKHLARVSNTQIDRDTKKDKPWTKWLSRREQRRTWNKAHSIRANRLTQRRLYAAIAIISLAVNIWVMTVSLPGYKAKAAKVDVLKKKIKLANITINDTAKDNAWLKGSYKKQVDKAIKKLKEAEKSYLKTEKDYQDLIAKM